VQSTFEHILNVLLLGIPAAEESLKDALQLIAEATVSIQELCSSHPNIAKAVNKILTGLECAQFAANQLTTVSVAGVASRGSPNARWKPLPIMNGAEVFAEFQAIDPKVAVMP
jgi:hypothetical protein